MVTNNSFGQTWHGDGLIMLTFNQASSVNMVRYDEFSLCLDVWILLCMLSHIGHGHDGVLIRRCCADTQG